MEATLGYIVTFIIGGGLVELLRGFREARKLKAEARSLEVSTDAKESRAEVDTLVVIIENLRADNETVRAERDYYRDRLNQALKQLDEVSEDLKRAQAVTTKLQEQITSLLAQPIKEFHND